MQSFVDVKNFFFPNITKLVGITYNCLIGYYQNSFKTRVRTLTMTDFKDAIRLFNQIF